MNDLMLLLDDETERVAKAKTHRAALALVNCAEFAAGETVQVKYYFTGPNGRIWYTVTHSEKGRLRTEVAYPEHHLARFEK